MKLSQPGCSWTPILVGRLEDGTSAFALTVLMGITGISHWCTTKTCTSQVKFPFMTNLCHFCTAYLSLFNLSQSRASKKSVLGNMQAARCLKATQASYFPLLVSGCLDTVLIFHMLVVSVQVKLSGLYHFHPFSTELPCLIQPMLREILFLEPLSQRVTLRSSIPNVTGRNKSISKHIYTAK